ncbi:inactive leucine-rich repeat receptor-like protein kinase [Pyrus ussuriensis x Pyrus communis]|uniref:Inactive leucine-rich repeat receptor-like protein kinase n=1 Tax=Pyrus ussuriensis x Pyrus communis TaxID=2448454 RepID=A0A5N5FVZ9_9ROSA|nr:inactive leucine-rich repeat receptor-like protein kinase [Pyrus ussuriensis x Pyrus communis]
MAFLIRDTLLSKQNLGNIFICCVLLLSCSFSSAVESDINCLKSLKATLLDPLGYLKSSWDFNNNTEGFICNFLGIECWHPHESKVLNIKLSDLELKGPFPHGVANCTSLAGLDLSSNELSGPLPEDIGRIISFITVLDLSSNSFSGQIPTNITNCSYLNVLKLDSNQFTGNIPLGIGHKPCNFSSRGKFPQILSNCSYLNVLKLENNEFSGEIPAQLAQLKSLSGPVPNFDGPVSFGPESYAGNSGLCGGPLKPCQ